MRAALARLADRPWLVLGAVMAVAAFVILDAGAESSFSGDELYYFSREADVAVPPVHYDSLSLEYILAPHNSHLQVGGKLVYEAIFAIFGADYAPFRVLEVLVVLLCIGLFFELARVRIGAPAALLLAILLCFMGAAWEVMLWPFDLHTAAALAAGLAALLVLERRGPGADPAVCGLLVLSIAFVEVGIAFAAAVAVSILVRPDRWRRLWVVAVPLVLYAAWHLWARQFEVDPLGLDTVDEIPGAMFDSLRSVLVALTGRLPTGDEVAVPLVGLTTFGIVLAVLVLVLAVLRVRRGSLPTTIWPLLTALLVYWVFIGLAERAPDSSRYVFAGAILVLLVAADAMRDSRPGPGVLAVLALVVALALPQNIVKLFDGGDYLAQDADLTRGEFAMFELAGSRADPEYVSAFDFQSRDAGASPFIVMKPPEYFDAADRIGSLADSLDEIRGENVFLRQADDVVLARLLGLEMRAADRADATGLKCVTAQRAPAAVEAPPEGVLVQAVDADVALALSRFTTEGAAFQLGELPAGEWARIDLEGSDAAAEPWRLFYDGRIRACALTG